MCVCVCVCVYVDMSCYSKGDIIKLKIGSLISGCLRRWKAADAALHCAINNSGFTLLNLDDVKKSNNKQTDGEFL